MLSWVSRRPQLRGLMFVKPYGTVASSPSPPRGMDRQTQRFHVRGREIYLSDFTVLRPQAESG
jgi:hypothetical protein